MDLRSFEHTYNQYAAELLRYSLSYGCSLPQSEEIVQDVFLSLWERRNELVLEGDIRPYLYKSIKYKVFDFFRNESKKQALIDELKLNACDFQCFTEEEVTFNEVQALIGHAIERLPCKCREVYMMSRSEGLKNKEIAIRLSISEKTVEQHLTKALRYLRQNLEMRS